MKDYERYMNRQKVSDAGMETLLKLETQRPERPRREESRVPQWLKYVGMAACFCLMMGLFALPILQGAQQQRAAGPNVTGEPAEELFFHAVDSVPFTDHGIVGGMKLIAMEQEDAAAIFGSAPDDFAGFLETVGLRKFDMEYYNVDMAGQGDDSCRFLMKGVYISPREGEVPPATSFVPVNTVWLEIYEGHSYLDEGEWKELESCTFHGHQVTAACVEDNYRAAAAFHVESGGKTYGVLYSVTADGERNAKEVVTKMVDYITQNGLFVEEREILSVKLSGWYVMETDGEKTWAGVPSVTFNEDGSFGVFVAYCSSHICQGDYEITDGRVTVRCPQHTYVFDILDEETLRFVAAESSEPEHYGDDDWPHITDGAVFRRLRDGKRAVTAVSKPQVEITDLGSSLWEERGSGTTKEGVSYELTYQANEAAAGKKLEFYLELSEEDQELLGLDGPVCIQTYCREAGECKSSKKVYGDFAYSSVSGQDIGDVTVRCVCDGEEIACKTMPWGSYMTLVWDVQQATHHPEPTHHVEESHHSDSHH